MAIFEGQHNLSNPCESKKIDYFFVRGQNVYDKIEKCAWVKDNITTSSKICILQKFLTQAPLAIKNYWKDWNQEPNPSDFKIYLYPLINCTCWSLSYCSKILWGRSNSPFFSLDSSYFSLFADMLPSWKYFQN